MKHFGKAFLLILKNLLTVFHTLFIAISLTLQPPGIPDLGYEIFVHFRGSLAHTCHIFFPLLPSVQLSLDCCKPSNFSDALRFHSSPFCLGDRGFATLQRPPIILLPSLSCEAGPLQHLYIASTTRLLRPYSGSSMPLPPCTVERAIPVRRKAGIILLNCRNSETCHTKGKPPFYDHLE